MLNIHDNLTQFVTICHVWVACWLGAVSWAGWVGLASALLRAFRMRIYAVSFHWGLFCMRIYAVSFHWGLFCMRIYAVSFPWGLFCMRIYRGILSLGTNLHAYLPWYPFPGD